MGPNLLDWCPYQKRKFGCRDRYAQREDEIKTHTKRRKPREDGSRDWIYAVTGKGFWGHQSSERGLEHILLHSPQRSPSCCLPIYLELVASGTVSSKFLFSDPNEYFFVTAVLQT